jgi:hypothetical protein
MVKATKISGKVNSSKSYFLFFLSTFLSIAVQAQNCPGCVKNTEDLKVKNKELERINTLLVKNKEVLQVANEKKESSLIVKIQNNLVLGMIKRDTVDAEIELLKIELKDCGVCNGK